MGAIAAPLVSLALVACGGRSDAPAVDGGTDPAGTFRHSVSGEDGVLTEGTVDAFASVDGDPDGPLRRGNLCVGFGPGPPVVDGADFGGGAWAESMYCGQDCSAGQTCPLDHVCWAVYQPVVVSGTPKASRDVVAYQCLPPAGECPAGATRRAFGAVCGRCDDDDSCL